MPGSPLSRRLLLDGGIDYVRRWGVVLASPGNEASGARLDLISSANDMTAVNVPTSAAGLVYPLARQYTAASSQYHSLADNAAVSGGAVDMWGFAWAYMDSNSAERTICSKYQTTGSQREWDLEFDNTANRFNIIASADGGAITVLAANTFGVPSISTWYGIMWYHRNGVGLGISVNGGAFDTAVFTGGIFDGTAAFVIGAIAVPGLYWNGRIGPVTLGKLPPGGLTVALATEIRDTMYHSGSGLVYPFRH